MKKRIGMLLVIIVIIIAIILGVLFLKRKEVNKTNTTDNQGNTNSVNDLEKDNDIREKEYSEDINVVATLDDVIANNSAWCGTFQLVWNDMQNEVVKQDIVFQKQIELVENLNKQTFKEDDISDEYYYKNYGLMTLDLKEEIEKGIKEKFNEPSDILDNLDWSTVPQSDDGYTGNSRDYLFYVMLYREFKFKKEFEELGVDVFKGSEEEYEDIKYFGIEVGGEEELYKQVDVLYYNSKEDFAVILNAKEGDEIILAKGENGATFGNIYDNVLLKSKEYDGKKSFTEDDFLKVPNLDLDILKKYEELIANGNPDKMFYNYKDDICEIKEAIQTIKLTLDKSGGKIKSEAAIVMQDTSVMLPEKVERRYFEFDSEFTIFLREGGKDLPYFAANIDDITLFQE